MKIGDEYRSKVRKYMKDEGITQREMAFRLGISHTTLHRILHGDVTSIQDATAEALARVIGEAPELVTIAPPRLIKRPCIAVTCRTDALMPHIEPGVKYMAVQEELALIPDGEIVVTEIWDTTSDGHSAYRPIIGFLRKSQMLIEIDCGKDGTVEMLRTRPQWIAYIMRPVSEIVVGGD